MALNQRALSSKAVFDGQNNGWKIGMLLGAPSRFNNTTPPCLPALIDIKGNVRPEYICSHQTFSRALWDHGRLQELAEVLSAHLKRYYFVLNLKNNSTKRVICNKNRLLVNITRIPFLQPCIRWGKLPT